MAGLMNCDFCCDMQMVASEFGTCLWNVVERWIRSINMQSTNLQQLRDAMLTWTGISKECFQDHVESMPGIIQAVLGVKGELSSTRSVYLTK